MNIKNPFQQINKFYKDLSIKRKLLLILYIQIIIPILFIGYMSYHKSSQFIQSKSIAYSQDILRMIELRLKDYVHNLTILPQDLLYNKKVYDALDYENLSYDPLKAYENEEGISNVLKQFVFSRNEIQSICLISNDERYYVADRNSEGNKVKEVIPYIEILDKARKGKGRVVWYHDIQGGKVENIFLARTVYDQNSFKEIGLIVILVRKEFLETVYQDLTTEVMQNIAIVSTDHKEIVSRNPDSTYLREKDFLNKIRGRKDWLIDKKRGVLISYISMDAPDWKVIAYISLREMFKEIGVFQQWLVIVSIISMLILSLLSIYIAYDFMNPINTLVSAMEKVQGGESSVNVIVDRNDELGFLSKTFNKMIEEINHLVKWIYREQLTRKEAEIKALQAQINPHFLFNTLESINWMARLNNVPQISNMVEVLSTLMEASIGRDDRLITVEEEFTYIDNYISILKMRFEDRLELQKEVQDEVLHIKIPRLLIQPLIENAVYHGIEKSRKKGVIGLKAVVENNMVTIEVTDNGPGMEKDELEILNEKLSMDSDTYFRRLGDKKSKSIGIENVNRRIKLFYGERYGLKIGSEAGKFTRVRVIIPLQQEKEI